MPRKATITRFDTSRYFNCHGRQPRTLHGERGAWWFRCANTDWMVYGTLVEAKAKLREQVALLVGPGAYVAEVLP